MKKSLLLINLLLSAYSLSWGSQYLTINGEDIDSYNLRVGESCTVEIVSDDTSAYSIASIPLLGFPPDTNIVISSTALAGSGSKVMSLEYGIKTFTASGDGIEPGVHFIIEIFSEQAKAFAVNIFDSSLQQAIDGVQIQFVETGPFRSAFTYSGRLNSEGLPADGIFDQEFSLFNDFEAVTEPILLEDVDVVDGFFTVELDFGADVFDGKKRYLQIAVRPGDSEDPNAFVVLQPRQEIMATPYALRAKEVDLDAIFVTPTPGSIPQFISDGRLGASIVRADRLNIGIGASGDLTDRLVVGNAKDDESFLCLNSKWTGLTGIRFRSEPLGADLVYDQNEKALSYYTNTDVATGWVRRIHVDQSGKVGIGASNPTSKLEVAGTIHSSSGGYKFPDGTVQTTAAVSGGPGGTITGVQAGLGLEGGGYGGVVSVGLEVPLDLYVATPDAVIQVRNDTGTYGLKGGSNHIGVQGSGDDVGVQGNSNAAASQALRGHSTGDQGIGVFGLAEPRTGDTGPSYGGQFLSTGLQGVGVYAKGVKGLEAESDAIGGIAVEGVASQPSGIGVLGSGETGVLGRSDQPDGKAFYGRAEGSLGVGGYFESVYGNAVHAVAENTGSFGAAGYFEAKASSGVGLFSRGGGGTFGYAAIFEGNVLLRNRSDGSSIMELGEGLDYAEGFDVSSAGVAEPGTVLIIDPDNPGKLAVSSCAYDKKVAGIVAGANGLGSGVRLGAGKFDEDVALAGRVYCNVDATDHAIEPGDLLTTSDMAGHAMKVVDYNSAQGAVLGKAMDKMEKGKTGRILVLVTLQ